MDKKPGINLPKAPTLMKIIGPSIILLGLGLGSGEIILWPYLVSSYGLGIIWGAVIGITFQFFINMEIERYSLVHGESIFVGFAKYFKNAPYWFIFSTFIAWFWPGLIASSAKILASVAGVEKYEYLAIPLLILIGLILTLGPSLYKTVERFQKILIGFGVPIIVLIVILVAKSSDWVALGQGLVGIGNGYHFLPKGIDLFVLLGALAYSGAGGNLNLAQSFYIKEKGYGMCKGAIGISSVLTGKTKNIQLHGRTFILTNENLKRFKKWWRVINAEHALIFLLTGAFIILMLALLSYATTYRMGVSASGIGFILSEAKLIGQITLPLVGVIFMLLVGAMLFGTQLTVLDSTSRIISENIAIIERKNNVSATYYTVLWLQIIAGICVFLIGYSDPISLIITGAVINALAMFVHIGLTYLLNKRSLVKQLQASAWRKTIILLAWLTFGVLAIWATVDGILKLK